MKQSSKDVLYVYASRLLVFPVDKRPFPIPYDFLKNYKRAILLSIEEYHV